MEQIEEIAGSQQLDVHNTTKISDFAKRSRELGKYIREQVLHREHEPVEEKDREAVRNWTLEARQHSVDPDALDVDYLDLDRPLDYHMLNIIFQQHSDMIRDVD